MLRKSTQIEERKMPEIPVWSVKTKEEDRKSKEKEMEALLTADLLENKRLSTETFIELQNDDPKIRKIKENLLGNPKAFDTFIIRNGILCIVLKLILVHFQIRIQAENQKNTDFIDFDWENCLFFHKQLTKNISGGMLWW